MRFNGLGGVTFSICAPNSASPADVGGRSGPPPDGAAQLCLRSFPAEELLLVASTREFSLI